MFTSGTVRMGIVKDYRAERPILLFFLHNTSLFFRAILAYW